MFINNHERKPHLKGRVGGGLRTVGKGLMVAEGSLREAAIIKLLPFEQKLSIEAGNQKRDALCCPEAA